MLAEQSLRIGRVSGLLARPRLPRLALSARVVSTVPARRARALKISLHWKAGTGEGVAEHWDGR